MRTTSCPFSTTDDQSCPALQPSGACATPSEVTQLVRAAVAQTASGSGVDATSLDVALECSAPGALRLVLRADGLDGRVGHRVGVRALEGLCSGARSATTISVCAEPARAS